METPTRLAGVELFAWIGEDELGSGRIGLKQGWVPAGMIPLVATTEAKILPCAVQMETQARVYGKRIYLCRFTCAEVVTATEGGDRLT